MINISIKFEHVITNIDKNNIDNKIQSYISELKERIIKNELENIKIKTEIKWASLKEVEISSRIEAKSK